jgi:hypothetical protein
MARWSGFMAIEDFTASHENRCRPLAVYGLEATGVLRV